jgi:dienelactone hydrolase
MKVHKKALFSIAFTAAVAAAQNQSVRLLPAPTGPFDVGRAFVEWTDRSRADNVSPDGHRQLVVWLWYPGAKTQKQPAAWHPGKWGELYWTRFLRSRPNSAAIGAGSPIHSILSHSYADVPPLPGSRAFPLLLLSPGGGELPLSYASLAEELASHGYIIAGIVPQYSGSCVYSDGRIVDLPYRTLVRPGADPVEAAVADLTFTLNQLKKLTSKSQWRNKIDFKRIGSIGHSIGGGASLEIARVDSRVRATVALDGGSAAGIAKPILYLHSAGEHPRRELIADLGQRTLTFLQTARPGYDLWITGAAHSFSTDHFVLPYEPRTVNLAGTIEPTRALAITRELVRAFFDQHLKGAKTSVSIGPSSRIPEIFVLYDAK